MFLKGEGFSQDLLVLGTSGVILTLRLHFFGQKPSVSCTSCGLGQPYDQTREIRFLLYKGDAVGFVNDLLPYIEEIKVNNNRSFYFLSPLISSKVSRA